MSGGTVAACAQAALSPDLQKSKADVVTVIVQYASAPTAAELAYLGSVSVGAVTDLHSINAEQLSLPFAQVAVLKLDTNVRYISLERKITHRGTVASVATSTEFTTQPINAPAVWSMGYDGTGIGVAVVDSGIEPSADLEDTAGNSRIVYCHSFVTGEKDDCDDHFGHGTHVSGLIGGNGAKSTGDRFFYTFYGVARNANLINLRVLDENGEGTNTGVILAIERAIKLKDKFNIRVLNLSLGQPIYESYRFDPLDQAVEQAWKAGLVVVVAAGNDGRTLTLSPEGYGTIEAPGNDPYAITVGATNSKETPTVIDDVMATYSSKGPSFIDQVVKPDIVAPGNLVTSLLDEGSTLQAQNPAWYTPRSFYITDGGTSVPSDFYTPLSGTSMSTGVVSGAVALLLQAVPTLTPDQVKAFLMRDANHTVLPATNNVTDPVTKVVYTAHNDIFTQGSGYLDIFASVLDAKEHHAKAPLGYAMSPTAVFNPKNGNVYLVSAPGTMWGMDTAMWGADTAMWGADTAMWGADTAMWGADTAMWGASAIYGSSAFTNQALDTAMWGADTAMWGANAPSAFTAMWGADTAMWGASDPKAFTALWANDTAMWGADTAMWGADTAMWGADTAMWGADTAMWGAGTAMWGADTAMWGADTAMWGADTAMWGAWVDLAATAMWGADTAMWGCTVTYVQ